MPKNETTDDVIMVSNWGLSYIGHIADAKAIRDSLALVQTGSGSEYVNVVSDFLWNLNQAIENYESVEVEDKSEQREEGQDAKKPTGNTD